MTGPTTAAGRALGEALPRFFRAHAYWRDFEPSVDDRIAAIETEAAAAARSSLLAELDAARAENARLRTALEQIAGAVDGGDYPATKADRMRVLARAALERNLTCRP